jgi:hypothetical protein
MTSPSCCFAGIARPEDAAAASREVNNRIAAWPDVGHRRFAGSRHVLLPGAAGNTAQELVADDAGNGMADGQAEARGIGQRAEIIRQSRLIDLLADAVSPIVRPRRRRVRSPVLMPTGQAVEHSRNRRRCRAHDKRSLRRGCRPVRHWRRGATIRAS